MFCDHKQHRLQIQARTIDKRLGKGRSFKKVLEETFPNILAEKIEKCQQKKKERGVVEGKS